MLNSQEEVKLKAMHMEEAINQAGIVGQGNIRPECGVYRPTLRDRLKRQIEHANETQHEARRANELYDLLDKYPHVARILELWEEIGGRGF